MSWDERSERGLAVMTNWAFLGSFGLCFVVSGFSQADLFFGMFGFALLATALGLKNSYINQPCEVPELRAQVQAHLSLNGAFPQLLARFGYGPAMPRSLRRSTHRSALEKC